MHKNKYKRNKYANQRERPQVCKQASCTHKRRPWCVHCKHALLTWKSRASTHCPRESHVQARTTHVKVTCKYALLTWKSRASTHCSRCANGKYFFLVVISPFFGATAYRYYSLYSVWWTERFSWNVNVLFVYLIFCELVPSLQEMHAFVNCSKSNTWSRCCFQNQLGLLPWLPFIVRKCDWYLALKYIYMTYDIRHVMWCDMWCDDMW